VIFPSVGWCTINHVKCRRPERQCLVYPSGDGTHSRTPGAGGQRVAKPPRIIQSLTNLFGMGCIQEWSAQSCSTVCASLPGTHDLTSGLSFLLLCSDSALLPLAQTRELHRLNLSISRTTKKVNAGNTLFWNICNWQLLPSISRPVKSLYINCVVINVICLMSPCLAVWETVSKCKNTTFFSWGSGIWLHQDIFISLYYFTMAFSNHSGWWT